VGSLAGEPLRHELAPHSAANLFYACTTWTVEAMPPSQLVAKSQPKRILVTMVDGTQVILQRPLIRGDRLIGRGDQTVSLRKVRTIATWETTILGRALTWAVAGVALVGIMGLAALGLGL
jgi:hypothetical protein